MSYGSRPPKTKIFVVVGVKDEEALIATLYVNTSINTNVNFSEYIRSLHILLNKNDHSSFLTHDSYLDCAHLIEKDKNELIAEFNRDTKILVGEIPASLLSIVISVVGAARTIETKKKKLYGFI